MIRAITDRILQGITTPVEGAGMGSFVNAGDKSNVRTQVVRPKPSEAEDPSFLVLMVAKGPIGMGTIVNSNPKTHIEISFAYNKGPRKGCGYATNKNADCTEHLQIEKFPLCRRRREGEKYRET
jgi:hypothetical protein